MSRRVVWNQCEGSLAHRGLVTITTAGSSARANASQPPGWSPQHDLTGRRPRRVRRARRRSVERGPPPRRWGGGAPSGRPLRPLGPPGWGTSTHASTTGTAASAMSLPSTTMTGAANGSGAAAQHGPTTRTGRTRRARTSSTTWSSRSTPDEPRSWWRSRAARRHDSRRARSRSSPGTTEHTAASRPLVAIWRSSSRRADVEPAGWAEARATTSTGKYAGAARADVTTAMRAKSWNRSVTTTIEENRGAIPSSSVRTHQR